jgi:two-component system, sensor histidine kinase RegB
MKRTPREAEIDPHFFEDSTGLENMRQLVQLRWIAVVGQIITIAVVHFGFDIQLPLREMSVVLICLVAFNIGSILRWREHHEVTNGELFFALLVDVATLTAQLYLSGGSTNPFSFLYLLQVILGAVLLRSWSVWTMVVITAACSIGLNFFYRPLAAPPSYFIDGTLICFVLIAALLVIFITRINRNLRARDARLADLRARGRGGTHCSYGVVGIGCCARVRNASVYGVRNPGRLASSEVDRGRSPNARRN